MTSPCSTDRPRTKANASFGYDSESGYPDLASVFPDINRWHKIGDGRPDNVKIPKPQSLSFPIFHQGRIKYIKLVVSFELNKNYRSWSSRNAPFVPIAPVSPTPH